MNVVWITSLVIFAIMFGFGSKVVRKQANEIYFVRTLGLMATVFVMMTVGGLLSFAAWWLKTWRRERLRPALVSLTRVVPWFAIMCLLPYLDHRFLKPNLGSFLAAQAMIALLAMLAVTSALMVTICVPWWGWVQPAVERALLRASRSSLRAGVAAAIAMLKD